VLGSLMHAFSGHPFGAERWADAAERAVGDPTPLPDGSVSVRAWVAVARAMLCRNGPERMRDDAALAVAELGPLSPLRAPAMWLCTAALLLLGDDAGADAGLEEAAEAARATGATFAGATAAAQRALLALGRGDLPAAQAHVASARAFVGDGRFEDYMPMALVLVAEARTEIEAGETDRAARRLAAAQHLRPYLTHAIPFYAVQTLIEIARAYLALGDVNGARTALFDAGEVLRHRPELGVLGDDVAKLRDHAAAADRPDSGWESSLTAAELRLLPLLTTHLNFREIGELLVVSRNTVKTQGISIYRKLGVTSRSEAVRRAAELGLLEPTVGAKITHDG
jgi:LuxR family maltose regulon positive regulatory protein